MPTTGQGDIFEAAARVQLAIVFGHIGFNEMGQKWSYFAHNHPKLSDVRDPFTELGEFPVEWSSGHWLWFVPEKQNHGMTEAQLTNALDAALAWASRNQLTSVATNGVANADHGPDTVINRRSDERRAALLNDYATQAEQKYKFFIELISLNDIFVRCIE